MTKTIANSWLDGRNGRHGFLKTWCLVFSYYGCLYKINMKKKAEKVVLNQLLLCSYHGSSFYIYCFNDLTWRLGRMDISLF